MKDASSETRKSTARATSSGRPGRPRGQTWLQTANASSAYLEGHAAAVIAPDSSGPRLPTGASRPRSLPPNRGPYPLSPVSATDSIIRRRRMMKAINIGTVLSTAAALSRW